MKRFVQGEMYMQAEPETVWSVLADFHHVHRWAREVTHCEPLGDVPRGLGAGRRCVIRGVGQVDEYITRWQPGESIGYSVSRLGPIIRSESDWQLRSAEQGGTHVSLGLHYEMAWGPLGRLLDRLLVRKRLQASIPRVLKRLSRHLGNNDHAG